MPGAASFFYAPMSRSDLRMGATAWVLPGRGRRGSRTRFVLLTPTTASALSCLSFGIADDPSARRLFASIEQGGSDAEEVYRSAV